MEDATLAWDAWELVVRPRAHVRWGREGRTEKLDTGTGDLVIRLLDVHSLRPVHPWPALEVRWEEDEIHRRFVAHPRGVEHPVPRTAEEFDSCDRFATVVEALIDEATSARLLQRRSLAQRGWLDDQEVVWEAASELPRPRVDVGPYRGSGTSDALLASTLLPTSAIVRVGRKVARGLGLESPRHDRLAQIVVSERAVWVVREGGRVLRIPREALRAALPSRTQLVCIFGRSTFLCVDLPPSSPVRALLIEASENEAARREQAVARLSW